MKLSKIIPIEKVEDGMILADPILNQFSQILIPAGTVLSDFHKKILIRWNIRYVNIYVNDEFEDEEIDDEIIRNATQKTLDKLLWTPENEIEDDLVHIAAKHLAKKMKLSLNNQSN